MKTLKSDHLPESSLYNALMKVLLLTALLVLASWQAQAAVVVNETSLVSGTYTVPSNGQVTITITGADGGEGSETNGGSGAEITGVFNVTAGQIIRYVVGEAGNSGTDTSAGGGGSTGVYIDTTLVLVAGAGGGGDNSEDADGLGGNTGENGDDGTGDGAGAGGTSGLGGGGNTNDSGGGGGAFGDGGSGSAGGGAQSDTVSVPNTATLLIIADGGSGNGSGSAGGDGFTGGGGADSNYSGGGGGYSGGGAAGASGSAGGGGSYINTGYSEYVSSSASAGVDGGGDDEGSELDGSIIVDFETNAGGADMAITKSVDVPYPREGDTVIYTLTATNNGPDTATSVVLTDTLPAGLTYDTALFTIGTGSCSDVGQLVTCTVTGSVASGSSVTVRIAATVNSGLGDVAVSVNTASVSAAENDPVAGNNTDTADITSCPASNIINVASVATSATDTNPANDSDGICSEVLGFTIVSIDSFTAFVDAGDVMVRWATGFESGTIGFHLERWDDALSSYVRINDELLPSLITSVNGAVYSYRDETTIAGDTLRYRLIEVDNVRAERVYGPFNITNLEFVDEHRLEAQQAQSSMEAGIARKGKRAHKRFVAAPRAENPQTITRFASARAVNTRVKGKTSENNRINAQSNNKVTAKTKVKIDGLKLTVREDGLYSVSFADLAAGFEEKKSTIRNWARKDRLQVSHRGKKVAFTISPDESAVLFYGEAIHSVFTKDNVYWIFNKKSRGMRTDSGGSPVAESAEIDFASTSFAEIDLFPITIYGGDPDADYYYWSVLRIDGQGNTGTSPQLPGAGVESPGVAATGTACLTVSLQGYNDDPAADADHLVWLRVNGVDVGEEESWDGISPHTYKACFEQDEVPMVDGSNDVRLVGRNTGDVETSIVLINNYKLTYQRIYQAVDDRIWVNGGANPVITVDGFGGDDIEVFALANTLRPRVVTDLTIEASASGYRVSFVPGTDDTPYLVQTASKRMAPFDMTAVVKSTLLGKKNKADHLVITPELFEESARVLVKYRNTKKFKSKVVTLEDIYNKFNDGIVNPHAIQDFLAFAADKWKQPPVYVALIGKGSLDRKDVQGKGGNLFPILQAETPQGLFACDSCYGDLNDDGVSEFSIGRIPVLSAPELDIYVTKLKEYENQRKPNWRNDLLFSADDPDDVGNFSIDSDHLAALVERDYMVEKAYLELNTATEVHDALMAGFGNKGLVNWVGHGNYPSLAKERVLVLDDILGTDTKPGMSNGLSLPLFAALTCGAGRFEVPGGQSLSEALVLRDGGGAIAAYSPSGLSSHADAVKLNEGLIRSLYRDGQPRIGDAARDAQLFYTQQPYWRFMLDIYNVMGDPATILH